jgi:hypothetical protein
MTYGEGGVLARKRSPYEPSASIFNSLGHRVHRRTASCGDFDSRGLYSLPGSVPRCACCPSRGRRCDFQDRDCGQRDDGRGILGIAAILMAYRPDRLRQNAKLKRRAMIFACAGIGAAALYVTSEGLTNVMSSVLKWWIVTGPSLLGGHCAYRVFMRPQDTGSTPDAV